MFINSFGLSAGNQLGGWNPSLGGNSAEPIQNPTSDAGLRPLRPSMLICVGFGSRGGFRQTGVVRKDEPMEKPTASTPIWPSPPAREPKHEEPYQSTPTVKTTIQ